MKTPKLKSVLLFATVLLPAAWLIFAAYMILALKDKQFLPFLREVAGEMISQFLAH
jgi:hypothetical protein